MQDQLRKCGVPAAEQIKSGKVDELLEWATKRNKLSQAASSAGPDSRSALRVKAGALRAGR